MNDIKVQKYDIRHTDEQGEESLPYIDTHPDGAYVLFSDWLALKAELDEMAARNSLFHDRVDALTKENDTLREDLREKSRQLGRAMDGLPIF